ncbi:hypothetical protein EXIGLDRAFT_589597, partial [Exidia glandulosa HHB12029]
DEYQRDLHSARLKMKDRFYNLVHNPSQPVKQYIDSIMRAASDLASIKRPVDNVEIIDSLIMHLDESWAMIKTILAARKDEPSSTEVRLILIEHQ